MKDFIKLSSQNGGLGLLTQAFGLFLVNCGSSEYDINIFVLNYGLSIFLTFESETLCVLFFSVVLPLTSLRIHVYSQHFPLLNSSSFIFLKYEQEQKHQKKKKKVSIFFFLLRSKQILGAYQNKINVQQYYFPPNSKNYCYTI